MPHVTGLTNEEFAATLQPQRKNCERLHVVSITGNRGRTVPLLLTADVKKKAMDLITNTEMRKIVGSAAVKRVCVCSCMHIVCAIIQR